MSTTSFARSSLQASWSWQKDWLHDGCERSLLLWSSFGWMLEGLVRRSCSCVPLFGAWQSTWSRPSAQTTCHYYYFLFLLMSDASSFLIVVLQNIKQSVVSIYLEIKFISKDSLNIIYSESKLNRGKGFWGFGVLGFLGIFKVVLR